MRWQIGQRCFGYSENAVGFVTELFGDFFCSRLVSLKQPFPHKIDTASQRRNPPHARDSETHASNLRIAMEAFVPPNPNEFERTVRSAAGRALFAMTFKSMFSSGARKLMLPGRN